MVVSHQDDHLVTPEDLLSLRQVALLMRWLLLMMMIIDDDGGDVGGAGGAGNTS